MIKPLTRHQFESFNHAERPVAAHFIVMDEREWYAMMPRTYLAL